VWPRCCRADTPINALPQKSIAKLNCRVLPGEPAEEVKATLERLLRGQSSGTGFGGR